jgi:uncharacterized protein YdaU (DUF1376 family)
MKKQKDPAFLMYPEKFLAGTNFMSNEQVGIYIRLLCYQHQIGHLSEKQIAQICGGQIDDEVMSKFTVDSEGKWYNEKLQEVQKERASYAERQKALAKKRWDKKKDAKAYANAGAMAYANEMPALKDTNENINTDTELLSKKTKTHVGESQTQALVDPLLDLYKDL